MSTPRAWWIVPALIFGLFSASPANAQNARKKADPAANLRDLFMDLDTNSDRVIERSEVPESAIKAFETLLSQGDHNHDGKLEAEEYRDLLQGLKQGAASVSQEEREARFKKMDRNGDNKLDKAEFRGGEARFAMLDRNSDGFLDRQEIPWLAGAGNADQKKAKKGNEPAGAMMERLRAMDKDGDGRISRAEFDGRPAMFDRLDQNMDGFLDKSGRKVGGKPLKEKKAAKKGLKSEASPGSTKTEPGSETDKPGPDN